MCSKCALAVYLGIIGFGILIGFGVPGLNDYEEEEKYKPSQCTVDKVFLSPDGDQDDYACSVINSPYYRYLNRCQEWPYSTQVPVTGSVLVKEYTSDLWYDLRHTIHDNVSFGHRSTSKY